MNRDASLDGVVLPAETKITLAIGPRKKDFPFLSHFFRSSVSVVDLT